KVEGPQALEDTASLGDRPPSFYLEVPVHGARHQDGSRGNLEALRQLLARADVRLAAAHMKELVKRDGSDRLSENLVARGLIAYQRDDLRQIWSGQRRNPRDGVEIVSIDFHEPLEKEVRIITTHHVALAAVCARTQVAAVEDVRLGMHSATVLKIRAAAA